MRSRFISIFIILAGGCSIIEDTDIQSQEELNQLKFSGFTIEQTRASTTPITSTVLEDSDINEIDPLTGTILKRLQRFTAPAMTGKMKYRSGATGNDLEFYVLYHENDLPHSWKLMKNGAPIEIYRFRYDDNGRLNKIITFISAIGEEAEEIHTADTIIYDEDDLIERIERNESVNFTEFMFNPYENGIGLGGFKFQGLTLYGQTCSGSNSNNCRFYYTNYSSTSGFTPGVNVSVKATSALGTTAKVILVEDDFNNTGSSNGSAGCCREADHYFFHPLMMWQGLIENSDMFLAIYLVDWIEPGAQINNNSGPGATPETLTIRYNYDR